MDNRSRSERTREAVLQAALTILTRDGAGRLTLDAIAKESGVSKGGLMHQFPSKDAVLVALMQREIGRVEDLAQNFLGEHGTTLRHPMLAAYIATSREVISAPAFALSFAIFGLLAQDPELLAGSRARDAARLAAIKGESADPDLAILRWLAARGLVQASLTGPAIITEEERQRLFARLLDDDAWRPLERPSP